MASPAVTALILAECMPLSPPAAKGHLTIDAKGENPPVDRVDDRRYTLRARNPPAVSTRVVHCCVVDCGSRRPLRKMEGSISHDIALLRAWLPGIEGDAVAERGGTVGGEGADAATTKPQKEEAIKNYLSQEAVPVLTKALTELCMEKNPPPPGQTVGWLIDWLKKQ